MFSQITKLIELTLQKALESSSNDDPNLLEARNKLINKMRIINKELESISKSDNKQLSLF